MQAFAKGESTNFHNLKFPARSAEHTGHAGKSNDAMHETVQERCRLVSGIVIRDRRVLT